MYSILMTIRVSKKESKFLVIIHFQNYLPFVENLHSNQMLLLVDAGAAKKRNKSEDREMIRNFGI